MTDIDLDRWHKENDHYLQAALTWLRLRLERLSEHPAAALPLPAGSHLLEHKSPAPADRTVTGTEVSHAAKEMDAASSVEPPPALIMLGQRLGLSRFERDVLLLCVAMEMDTRIAQLCAHTQGDQNRPYPTFALALVLFDQPRWDVLSPERPLRHWRLIEINQPAAQPLTTSPLRTDERIVNYVKGLNYLDDRLSALLAPLELDEEQEELPPSQQAVVEAIVRHWRLPAVSSSAIPIVQLVGPDAASKQAVAFHTAAQFHRYVCRMPIEMLPAQAADLETLARLWQRESMLLPLALYLDAQEIDGATAAEGQGLALARFLARSKGYFFVGTREAWSRLGQATTTLDVQKPTPSEQKAAWAAALNGAAPAGPGLLASEFKLNLASIRRIASEVLEEEADAKDDDASLTMRLWDACQMSGRPRLDALAQRLEPKATWDDLVLPDEEMKILHQIADQVGQRYRVYEEWGFAGKMNRGLGINALFAGDSGTGKTMAAEVIANHLRLNLYRIDLSAVVSKYIGETEKNLRRLFDAAEDGGAILFFDEADALFGKRSEVKDSHDRYANIEINYLLQRMEAYTGLSILATNMKSALDTAFVRRLRFIVNFPFPGLTERTRMWQKVFPLATQTDGVNAERLARLTLTGGSISNVAINSAFLASKAGTPVTMPLVLASARAELRKLERPINEAEFR
jgi:hypothetical protein